ncbi:SDR family oxidoreductase [Streptomyces sp. NPDC002680]|uniref:SDR family oxidoreductase n=1 Tax=Streptomyces sp. NPDC002680 TaxID=3364659 RepID=UPI0036B35F95
MQHHRHLHFSTDRGAAKEGSRHPLGIPPTSTGRITSTGRGVATRSTPVSVSLSPGIEAAPSPPARSTRPGRQAVPGGLRCAAPRWPGGTSRRRRRRDRRHRLHAHFGQANYVAAKAGVVGLTRAIPLETAGQRITVNAIAPGLIETPMPASMNDKAREKLIGKGPMRHTGGPTDISEAAAFLRSPTARYITSVVLDVDGGIGIGSSIR